MTLPTIRPIFFKATSPQTEVFAVQPWVFGDFEHLVRITVRLWATNLGATFSRSRIDPGSGSLPTSLAIFRKRSLLPKVKVARFTLDYSVSNRLVLNSCPTRYSNFWILSLFAVNST